MGKTRKKASSQIDTVLLPYTAWMLLLLVPITFFGFYPSYYSTFKAPPIIHIHGILMALWLAMVLIQPWLVKTDKIDWHRLTGKLSYLLMPCILIVGYLVLRYGFLRVLGGDTVAPPEYYPEGATPITKAADFVVIGSVYLSWLFLYYLLGIIFRKKTYAHATFMLAAALTVLGPGGDRLLGSICDALGWEYNALAGNFTFGVVFLLFGSLVVFHKKSKLPVWPAITVLALHALGIFLYYTMPFHSVWESLATFLFSSA